MTSFFRAEDVVDVENVVAIFIIITVVLGSFARLRQHTAGVPRGFVFEARVADAVRRRQMDGKCL